MARRALTEDLTETIATTAEEALRRATVALATDTLLPEVMANLAARLAPTTMGPVLLEAPRPMLPLTRGMALVA